MGASIHLERHFGPLNQLQLVTAQDMKQIGLFVRERIVRRTQAGMDANGQPFRAYSEGYAKQKAKALGAGPVNLQVSGAMLNDLTIVDVRADAEQASVTLGWTR